MVSNSESWRAEYAVAGNRRALEALRELIVYPFLYSDESRKLGLKWPRGLLLYGPPGTGKTSLVQAVVRESDAHLIKITYLNQNFLVTLQVGLRMILMMILLIICFLILIMLNYMCFCYSSSSVHRAHAGESEKFLRETFSEAYSHASSGKPSVIFIDEIDAICPRRNDRREQESRIVGQLLTLMDGNKTSSKSCPHVVIVAATNRVDGIDLALRRYGRFDLEIEVTVPTAEERLQIIELHSKHLKLDQKLDLQAIAASCNGYVGADLQALCRQAELLAHRRSTHSSGNGHDMTLLMEDWESARSVIHPSITKGINKEVPNVSWDDIGGLKDLKEKLKQAVEWPIKHAAAFDRLKISPVRGILLHGPPGCSKTTLAKAAAHAAQASYFSLGCPDIYSMFVGEGEATLRRTFQNARLAAPSIIFFDEFEAMCPKRGHSGNSGKSDTVGERLLSTLLTEMDGLELATGIIVLAATNLPHAIDAALMRPGRFDLVLYVPPPDLEGRHEVLKIHTRKMMLGDDVDLMWIAECTKLFTGSDLKGLCREAGLAAIREDKSSCAVHNRHFQVVLNSIGPSLTKSQIEQFSSALAHRQR